MNKVSASPVFSPTADLVLFEGDCIEFLPTIPSETAKLIVTSPPYNLGKEYEKRLSLERYLNQQYEVIKDCCRILHPKGSLCWQVGNYVENGEIIRFRRNR